MAHGFVLFLCLLSIPNVIYITSTTDSIKILDSQPTVTCPSTQFKCTADNKCISISWRCDHVKDCSDNEDEENCESSTTVTCSANQFLCHADQLCISQSWFCDKVQDCSDNEDENDCPTPPPTIATTTTTTTSTSCLPTQFQCSKDRSCISGSWRCDSIPDCPDDEDEHNCPSSTTTTTTTTTKHMNNCLFFQFRCDADNKCIPISFACNGDTDCSDNQDEYNCVVTVTTSTTPPPCPSSQFKCTVDHICIPLSSVCDSIRDCSDNQDEVNCPTTATYPTTTSSKPVCNEYQFQCNTGYCISNNWVCDTKNDCVDNSDEMNCPTTTMPISTEFSCSTDEFACQYYRKCISNKWLCDGIDDCGDSSDEEDCNLPSTVPSTANTDPTVPSLNCEGTDVQCGVNMPRCIPADWLCDGYFDCDDGSDEQNCDCLNGGIRCEPLSICLNQSQICDHIKQCPDDSDEDNCQCLPQQYKCSTGECIPRNMLCDGMKDCQQGDDESVSRCPSCDSSQFTCHQSRACIANQQRCDGQVDCSDGSDEVNCLYLSNSTNFSQTLQTTYKGQSDFYVCSTGWSMARSDVTCKVMGYRSVSQSTSVYLSTTHFVKLKTTAELLNGTMFLNAFEVSSYCENNQFVSLTCLNKACGRRNLSLDLIDSYIVGGSLAKKGSWPWHAQVYFNHMFVCGGTIVNENWILTAGQCLKERNGANRPMSNFTVKVGSNILYDYTVPTYNVSTTIGFGYNATTNMMDLGMLKLARSIQFDNSVQPICLPDDSDITKYDVCVTSGYGTTDPSGKFPISQKLLQGRMNLLPYNECILNIQSFTNLSSDDIQSRIQTPYMMCAGSVPTPDNINICTGDAGGPLMCRDPQFRWTQLGISSHTYVKSVDNVCAASIFTNVSTFASVIRSVVDKF